MEKIKTITGETVAMVDCNKEGEINCPYCNGEMSREIGIIEGASNVIVDLRICLHPDCGNKFAVREWSYKG
jgi:hypothetical protein